MAMAILSMPLFEALVPNRGIDMIKHSNLKLLLFAVTFNNSHKYLYIKQLHLQIK